MKQPTTKVYNAALYMRLSRDDANYGDSVSIETQRAVLHQFAVAHHLNVYDEYIDDGWSGTNFDRPAFQRMMQDVNAGRVNCIVTKDLSRFGREHVMMGYYLEFVFPEKHIRYIAVSENEDSEKGLSDFVPFKNLFNEWYAKDTSRKVKAAWKARFEAGEHFCTYAPLGYLKDPEKKNHLIIDSETRWIIERIFDLALQGKGASSITKQLIEEKIPTPGWVKFRRNGSFAHIYANAPKERQYAWTIHQVKSILTNEVYIGNTIHYKQRSISYKSKKKVNLPPSEWVRVENTHDSIISEEVFQQVQKQISSRRRKCKNGEVKIFAGLVKCADCGWSMVYGTHSSKTKPWGFYHCAKHAQGLHAIPEERCSFHYIRYDTLYSYVLLQIQYWAEQAQHNKEHLLRRLIAADNSKNSVSEKARKDLVDKLKKRKTEVDILFGRLYEDWASNRITEYNFNMLSDKYQTEQSEIAVKLQELECVMMETQEKEARVDKWLSLIQEIISPTELTAELLNTLIEKILIHEAVKNDDGTKTQEIEIYYRYIGKID